MAFLEVKTLQLGSNSNDSAEASLAYWNSNNDVGNANANVGF